MKVSLGNIEKDKNKVIYFLILVIQRIYNKLQRMNKKEDVSKMDKKDLLVKVCGGVRNKEDVI
jgi:hypothetical protein